MNSKLVWAVVVLLVIYGAYLMMNKTEVPVVEVPVVTEEVATTTIPVVEDTNASGTPATEVPAAN